MRTSDSASARKRCAAAAGTISHENGRAPSCSQNRKTQLGIVVADGGSRTVVDLAFGSGDGSLPLDARADCGVALDPDTGNIKWHFQYTPNEMWDYDEIGAHVLIDGEVSGQQRKLVTHFGRNGFYYGLDRNNGSFVNGAAYVDKVTWSKGLDSKTGKPLEYDPTKDVQSYVAATRPGGEQGKVEPACPSIQGGSNYWPVSYDPKMKRLFAVAHETCAMFPQLGSGGRLQENARGSVVQLDPATGKVTKKRITPFVPYGGALTTAGGLVFSPQIEGTFEAMDSTTLDPLWSVNLGAGINAPPISFAVGDKQYIAILVGGGGVSELLGYVAKGEDPEAAKNLQPTAMLYVFSL